MYSVKLLEEAPLKLSRQLQGTDHFGWTGRPESVVRMVMSVPPMRFRREMWPELEHGDAYGNRVGMHS